MSPAPDRSPLPIAVLISGGGTTLKNLIERRSRGDLPVAIRQVISSTSTAGGLRFAETAGIPHHVIRRRDHVSAEAYSQAMFDCLRSAEVDYVVMGGFLQHLLIAEDFRLRVVNIHPSLIPSFSGQGMYGLRVHQAALAYGVKVSGCTVHFVDDQYDHGPVILQRVCPVNDDDTAETLQRRVFGLECEALPEALTLLQQGRLIVSADGRHVRCQLPLP
jgi:phosphoribosylglycinamide formyltransferase-1